ncbi:MAG: PAS domain-containing protein, partial [Pseudomonadota bacterium]
MTNSPQESAASPRPTQSLADMAAHLLAKDIQMSFDAESGTLVEANAAASEAIGLSGDAAESGRTFGEIFAQPSENGADLWWEVSSGSCTDWAGALLSSDGERSVVLVRAAVEEPDAPHRRVIIAARALPPAPPAPQPEPTLWDNLEAVVGVIEYDNDGNITAANDRAMMALEYYGEEMAGKHHDTLWPNSVTMSPDYAEFWEKIRQGRTVEGRHEHVSAMGEAIWLQSVFVPKRDGNGHVVGAIQALMDVSEVTYKSFAEAEVAAAVEGAVGVAIYDTDGHLVRANDAYLDCFGITSEDAVGMKHSRMVEASFARGQLYTRAWNDAAEGKPQRLDVRHNTSSGRTRWMDAVIAPVIGSDGTVKRYVVTGSDVTDQRAEFNELKQISSAFEPYRPSAEFDVAGKMISTNRPFRDLFGVEAEDVIGTNHADWCDDAFGKSRRHEEFWDKLLEGEGLVRAFKRKAPNGRELWLQITYAPVTNDDGRVTRIAITAQDINTNKRQALENKGRMTAIDTDYAVAEYSPDGIIEYANDQYLSLFGYNIEDLRGRSHSMFVSPDDTEYKNQDAFWENLRKGSSYSDTVKRVDSNGRQVWIRTTYSPIKSFEGRPIRVLQLCLDVTSQVTRMTNFESKWNAVNSGMAIVEFETDGRVVEANEAFLRLTGYSRRDVYGQHHSLFCSPDYIQTQEYRDFWIDLAKGEQKKGRFHRIGRFNRDIHISASYSPVLDMDGNIQRVIKFARDISEQVALENEMQRMTDSSKDEIQNLLQSRTDIEAGTRRLKQNADKSRRVTRENQERLNHLLQSMNAASDAAGKVTEVVEIIGDIAVQTNLLAFNA